LLADNALLARDYIRSHSHRVADVMTREVITAGERTQLAEIRGRHEVRLRRERQAVPDQGTEAAPERQRRRQA
jgi:hypothetical protein